MIHFHVSLFVSCGTTTFLQAKHTLHIGNCLAIHPSPESGIQEFINAFDDNYRSGDKLLLTLRCWDYLWISFIILISTI